jgi:hypothetical protein
MTIQTNHELQEWMDDWQSEPTASTPSTKAREIRDHVRQRQRQMIWWVSVEALLGFGSLAFLLHRAISHPDPVEKLAMGLLAFVVAAVLLFGAWNWHGALGASGETTSAFLAISLDRSRRMERGVRAGWAVLVCEVVVFVPWIWYQLHGGGATVSLERALFAWGFLSGMVGLGVAVLLTMQAFVRREELALEELRKELAGDDLESVS